MPVYQPNIPTGSIPLNQDYLNLQGNFQQLNIAYGVDHVPYTDTTGVPPAGITGMHTAIHLVPVSTTASNPLDNQPINGYTATPGYGQILSAQINDMIAIDEAFFFLSGGNNLIQMTRNFVPTVGSNGSFPQNGYTFLPGGFIFQWGVVLNPGASGTVTFSTSGCLDFPSNIFNVSLTQRRDASNSAQGMYINGALTKTAFSYNGSSSSDQALFWTAIGN